MRLGSRKYLSNHRKKDSLKPLTKFKKHIYGSLVLRAKESSKINLNQIEVIYLFIRNKLKQKKTKIWNKLFLKRSVSKKPSETRMGKGKGRVKYWAYITKPGCTILEIATKSIVKNSQLNKLKNKLSIKYWFEHKNYRWIL